MVRRYASQKLHMIWDLLWKNCLIGQFFRASPHISQIVCIASKIWRRRGKIDVIPFGCDSFLFKFKDAQTKRWVLEGGQWYIASKHLLLQQWVSGMSMEKLPTTKIPLWLPMEQLTGEALSYIASVVGVPLFLDKATEEAARIGFARACVEVNSTDTLPDVVEVDVEEVGNI